MWFNRFQQMEAQILTVEWKSRSKCSRKEEHRILLAQFSSFLMVKTVMLKTQLKQVSQLTSLANASRFTPLALALTTTLQWWTKSAPWRMEVFTTSRKSTRLMSFSWMLLEDFFQSLHKKLLSTSTSTNLALQRSSSLTLLSVRPMEICGVSLNKIRPTKSKSISSSVEFRKTIFSSSLFLQKALKPLRISREIRNLSLQLLVRFPSTCSIQQKLWKRPSLLWLYSRTLNN